MKEFIRIWEKADMADIEKKLIVVGDLSSECFCCHKVGINLKANFCPECGVHFKYVGFRRKVRPSFLKQMKDELPHLIFIDFDDFKQSLKKRDARKLLDL